MANMITVYIISYYRNVSVLLLFFYTCFHIKFTKKLFGFPKKLSIYFHFCCDCNNILCFHLVFDCTSGQKNRQGISVQSSSQTLLAGHATTSTCRDVKSPLSCSPEIYTVQGNSHGRPCHLPFLYDGQWFHSCTSTSREDGHLWCATTSDYGKDELYGFCPVKSELSLYSSVSILILVTV